MKKDKKNTPSGKQRPLVSRLVVAFFTLSLAVVLILWDTGVIDLPFLVRRERREPLLTETAEDQAPNTQEMLVFDWDAYSRECLSRIYNFTLLENGNELISTQSYNATDHSLVKMRIPAKDYRLRFGFLIDPSGVIYRGSDLAQIPNSQNFAITPYRDDEGRPVFQNRESRIYHVLDEESMTFSPILFHSASRPLKLAMPASFGTGEEDRSLIFESGLFGYSGTYMDGRRKKTFTVPTQYPVAFPYSEGFAVMADSEGGVTVRNEKGEEVLTSLSLMLTEKTGYEALGFQGFDHGLLRVKISVKNEDGTQKETREAVIDQDGKEYTLPEGYRVLSYYDGVFVLTDGTLFGYYSYKGEWITPPVYTEAQPFFEGTAVVRDENGKAGMIQRDGTVLIPCAFQSLTSFSDGFSLLQTEDGKLYLLTKVNGKYLPEGVEDPIPPSSAYYTKVTITRGPQNTFVQEEVETLVLPEVVTTTTRKPLPEFWE